MGKAYIHNGGLFRQLLKWFINIVPNAPVIKFDGSNEPKDFDPKIRENLIAEGVPFGSLNAFDVLPQGNALSLPQFTLGNRFLLEFRFFGVPSDNNEFACIFSNRHDRQGSFADDVFAIYPPNRSESNGGNGPYPTSVLAMHFVPQGDPNHKPFRFERQSIFFSRSAYATDGVFATATSGDTHHRGHGLLSYAGRINDRAHYAASLNKASSISDTFFFHVYYSSGWKIDKSKSETQGTAVEETYSLHQVADVQNNARVLVDESTISETDSRKERPPSGTYRFTGSGGVNYDVGLYYDGEQDQTIGTHGIECFRFEGVYSNPSSVTGHTFQKIDASGYTYKAADYNFDSTSQDQTFGGQRMLVDGLIDNQWHNVRILYNYGQVTITADTNDNDIFATFPTWTNHTHYDFATNTVTTPRDTINHRSGFTSPSTNARLMGAHIYNSLRMNEHGLLGPDSKAFNGSTRLTAQVRFNSFRGDLGSFKMTLFPNATSAASSGSGVVAFDYKMKDGPNYGAGDFNNIPSPVPTQIVADSSANRNHAKIIWDGTPEKISTFWHNGQNGIATQFREVKEFWVNRSGVWSKYWDNKIQIFVGSDTENLDVFTEAGSPSIAAEIEIFVSPGVVVGATSTANAALYTSSDFATGTSVTLYNRGVIMGAGGDGGDSPYSIGLIQKAMVQPHTQAEFTALFPGVFHKEINTGAGSTADITVGGDGGNAIDIGNDLIVYNYGYIMGGGGGSGGRYYANYYYRDNRQNFVWGSNPGGGGSGYVGGRGGIATKQTSGTGSNWIPGSSPYMSTPSTFPGDPRPTRANGNLASGSSGPCYSEDGFSYKKERSFDKMFSGGKTMIGRHNFNLVTENTQSRGGGLGEPGENTQVGTIENYKIHIAKDNGERGAAIQTRGFSVNVLVGNSGVKFKGGLFDTTNRPSYNDDVGFEEERPTGTLPAFQFPKGEDALFDDGGLW